MTDDFKAYLPPYMRERIARKNRKVGDIFYQFAIPIDYPADVRLYRCKLVYKSPRGRTRSYEVLGDNSSPLMFGDCMRRSYRWSAVKYEPDKTIEEALRSFISGLLFYWKEGEKRFSHHTFRQYCEDQIIRAIRLSKKEEK